MNQKTDNFSPEAKSIWMSLCNNALIGRVCNLYKTPEVRPKEFDEATKRLDGIREALDKLLLGKDTTFTAEENLAFVNSTGLFMNMYHAFREKIPVLLYERPRGYERPWEADAAQAQTYYREAIDAIQPVVMMAKMRLWPDTYAVHQIPEWTDDFPPNKRSGPNP